MKEFISVLISSVLVNNVVMSKAFGVSATLTATNNKKVLSTSLYIASTMFVSTMIAWVLSTTVLTKISFLNTFVFVVVCALVAFGFKAIFKKDCTEFILALLNSAVLGLCLINTTAEYTIVPAISATLGASLGLIIAMFMYAGVKSRINQKYVANSFKGLPIEILAAGIIALAMVAFK